MSKEAKIKKDPKKDSKKETKKTVKKPVVKESKKIQQKAIVPSDVPDSVINEQPKTTEIIKEEIREELIETAKDTTKKVVDKDYSPVMVKIPELKNNIFDYDANPIFSPDIDLPKFSYGFQHFIHATKNKMEILKQYEGRKKIYLVMNKFERYIDSYEQSMGNVGKEYFGLGKDKPDILSRGFYKLWELLFMFDVIDLKKDNFVSAHLAEGPGSFIQATMFFRELYSKKSVKNDQYYAVTLHSEDTTGHVPPLEKNFIEYYEKEKPQRFILHKTYAPQVAGGFADKDDGDLTNPKTIKLFGGQMKEKADFITADGGKNWEFNENTQEQEAYRLIFAQIIAGLKIQKKGGNFICKLFETYTATSVKFIAIVKSFYKDVHLVKPLTSRESNAEKYMVCLDFKYDDKDAKYKSMISKLDEILEKAHKNNKLNLYSIFPEYQPPKELIESIIYINTKISNIQFKILNDIFVFIESNNHNGDIYQMKREQQIFANKYWISTFFPIVKDFENKIKDVRI